MALRIEKAFNVSMDTLLRMQMRYDSYFIRQRADEIDVAHYKATPESATDALIRQRPERARYE